MSGPLMAFPTLDAAFAALDRGTDPQTPGTVLHTSGVIVFDSNDTATVITAEHWRPGDSLLLPNGDYRVTAVEQRSGGRFVCSLVTGERGNR